MTELEIRDICLDARDEILCLQELVKQQGLKIFASQTCA